MSKVWKEYLDANKERFLNEMLELLRIPSVSTDTAYKKDMLACAELVKQKLLDSGCDKAVIMHTDGHPVVYGEKIVDDKRPTVLVYGHYDVQPTDPIELWDANPFEPMIKNNKVFARGAADDKGQSYMHLKVLEILNKTNSLTNNIKFLIEGEEEIGSPNLNTFIKANKNLLQADIILISDSEMISKDIPSLEAGFRGISLLELEITSANRDLHSGSYGGAIANPIAVLSKMIASLHDENNHITVPGFYDNVLMASAAEKQLLSAIPFDEDSYRDDLGIKKLAGEKGYTTNERIGIRPTIEINGIWGGYAGEGVKTVIPAKATAKISARLVPAQSSADITKKLVRYFKSITPDSVELKIKTYPGSEPYLIPCDSPGYKAAASAIEKIFHKTPIAFRDGGSLPLCHIMETALGIKSVLLGFGLPGDNIHSANENYDIDHYYKGIETILYFHEYFARLVYPDTK